MLFMTIVRKSFESCNSKKENPNILKCSRVWFHQALSPSKITTAPNWTQAQAIPPSTPAPPAVAVAFQHSMILKSTVRRWHSLEPWSQITQKPQIKPSRHESPERRHSARPVVHRAFHGNHAVLIIHHPTCTHTHTNVEETAAKLEKHTSRKSCSARCLQHSL